MVLSIAEGNGHDRSHTVSSAVVGDNDTLEDT